MVLAIFYGLKHIPLAEFVSLTFSIPFFVALFSPWLLKEKVTQQAWLATAIGFIGVMFVLRPTPDHFHIAHLTSLLMAFLTSLVLMSARYLSTTENRWSLNFYLPVAGIILYGYWALSYWVDPTTTHWLMFCYPGGITDGCAGLLYRSLTFGAPVSYCAAGLYTPDLDAHRRLRLLAGNSGSIHLGRNHHHRRQRHLHRAPRLRE